MPEEGREQWRNAYLLATSEYCHFLSSVPTDTLVEVLERGLIEIDKLNKRITASKQLKEKTSNPKDCEELDSLIKRYISAKGEIVEKYRNQLKELEKSIHAKQIALTHQRNMTDSINAELKVEEQVAEDQSKITKLKSDLSSAKDILDQLSQEHARLEDMKKRFLDAVEEHGFDRVNLTPPYEVVGMKAGSKCPRCKSQETVYVDKNSPNPKTKCLSCDHIWKT